MREVLGETPIIFRLRSQVWVSSAATRSQLSLVIRHHDAAVGMGVPGCDVFIPHRDDESVAAMQLWIRRKCLRRGGRLVAAG